MSAVRTYRGFTAGGACDSICQYGRSYDNYRLAGDVGHAYPGRRSRGIRFDESLGRTVEVIATSNIVSTVVGIPVTWGILFGVQAITGGGRGGPSVETLVGKLLAVTWQAPWLLPYESASYWMVPVAMLALLVPFFFASWFIEYQVSKRMMRGLETGVVKNAVLRANLASYALLVLVVIGALAVRIYQHVY